MGEDPGTGSEAVTTSGEAPTGPARESERVPPTTTGGEPERVQPTTPSGEPEQIEREIERTREQLGDTVEALARKTDVKAQAKEKLEETKANLSVKTEQLLGRAQAASPDGASEAAAQVSQAARENPLPLAAFGAFAAGFLAGRITKRSR